MGIHHRDRALGRPFGRFLVRHLPRQRVEPDAIDIGLREKVLVGIDLA
jgi:hypothetical protein